jgi:hypothetical protein
LPFRDPEEGGDLPRGLSLGCEGGDSFPSVHPWSGYPDCDRLRGRLIGKTRASGVRYQGSSPCPAAEFRTTLRAPSDGPYVRPCAGRPVTPSRPEASRRPTSGRTPTPTRARGRAGTKRSRPRRSTNRSRWGQRRESASKEAYLCASCSSKSTRSAFSPTRPGCPERACLIESTAERVRLTNTIYIDGPLAWLWSRLLGRQAERDLPDWQRKAVEIASVARVSAYAAASSDHSR